MVSRLLFGRRGRRPVVCDDLGDLFGRRQVEADATLVAVVYSFAGSPVGMGRRLTPGNRDVVFQLTYVHRITVIVRKLVMSIWFLRDLGHHGHRRRRRGRLLVLDSHTELRHLHLGGLCSNWGNVVLFAVVLDGVVHEAFIRHERRIRMVAVLGLLVRVEPPLILR